MVLARGLLIGDFLPERELGVSLGEGHIMGLQELKEHSGIAPVVISD